MKKKLFVVKINPSAGASFLTATRSMAEIVVASSAAVVTHIIARIQRQLNYLCCFSTNIQSLMSESQILDDARVELQMKVEDAERNAEVITPAVTTWLRDAVKIQEDAEKFIVAIPSVRCFSFRSRYSLSRKAKKTADVMKMLRDEAKFDDPIAMPAPPATTASIPTWKVIELRSRKRIEDSIMKALEGKAIMIGIHGMGGVGKTTMAIRILNRAREDNLFDEVVMVVVGQYIDIWKIHQEIGELLGLEFRGGETFQGRADMLRDRLTSSSKRTLIVLDDIWEEVKLKDLGIPCENGCCAILLTSRDRDVLNQMDAKIFAIDVLLEEEAWYLFKDAVGPSVDDVDLISMAGEFARECKGLPIALRAIGGVLKGKPKPFWESALRQLMTSNSMHIPTIPEEIYKPLRLSYDSLEDMNAKYLFLLCGIFPEGFIINLEELTWYMVGLLKFEEIESLEAAKNTVLTAVDTLKSRSLLLDGGDEYHVRMHDVIRDAAIAIALQEMRADVNHMSMEHISSDREWISIFPTSNWSWEQFMESSFPNLCLLLMHFNTKTNIQVDDLSFLEGMERLSVLSFRSLNCKKPPKALQLSQNLRTLQLLYCNLNSISVIGELRSLEILICVGCHQIEELPAETGNLKHLKLLNISQCKRLKRIHPGVISNLVGMEQLTMLDSFDEWESKVVNEEERRNASLLELESLSKLVRYDIQMKDCTMVGLDMFAGIESLGAAKNRVSTIVDTLKSQCLLLDGEDKYHLRMHDVICDVAVFVAPEEGIADVSRCPREYFSSNRERISVFSTRSTGISEQFMGSNFPKHRLLLVHFNRRTNIKVNHSFLEGMEGLNMLSFRSLNCKRLPQALHLLKNLRTLQLLNCYINSISVIGDLSGLEILICMQCHLIVELPIEIGKLKQLKLLNISKCEGLKRIPPGVISNLVEMEELRILYSFGEWESRKASGEERKNASLLELESLSKLRRLEIQIKDYQGSKRDGEERKNTSLSELESLSKRRRLEIQIKYFVTYRVSMRDGESIGDTFTWRWLKQRRHDLFPSYDSTQSYDFSSFFCYEKGALKTLGMDTCPSDDIENIWCHQIPPFFFQKPGRLKISNLENLKRLFMSSRVEYQSQILNLRSLCIKGCKQMENVIAKSEGEVMEGADGGNGKREIKRHMAFKKLVELTLEDLPNLTSFSRGIESIEFPVLKDISIFSCPEFLSVVSSTGSKQNETEEHSSDSVHCFCYQEVKFGGLEALHIK